jgi:putative ABC transport system substrate-binding protein
MRELGWIQGRNVEFIERFDDGGKEKLPRLAAELVAAGVDVLAVSDYAVPAARGATKTVPIVAIDTFDPIAEGITSDLRRPGGNVTGVSWQTNETAAKRLELAKELLPDLARVALLTDPGDSGPVIEAEGFRAAATRLKLELRTFAVRHARDFPIAFDAIMKYRPQALMITTNGLTIENLDETLRFAATAGLPTFSEVAPFAEAGVLLTYGPDMVDAYKRAAVQVDKLLRGAKAGDLPFEQPAKFDLVVNMKTAKLLGLRIPESIMVRVTRIVQ